MPLFLNFFSKNWHYEVFAAEKASFNTLRKFRCIAGKHGLTVTVKHFAFFGRFRKIPIGEY
jgi:hypothetical protein